MLNDDVECFFSGKHRHGCSGARQRGAQALAPRGPGVAHGGAGPWRPQVAARRPQRPRAAAQEAEVAAGGEAQQRWRGRHHEAWR